MKEANEILVLDDGEVVERGDHQALIQKGGIYADLFHHQQLSEELEQL